jgi:predicted aldo/keto reductase-like oxidoreductase
MEQRSLGRSGISVSAIGLGTEYLLGTPPDNMAQVVRRAVEQGVTYFDLFWPQPEFRDGMGAAFAPFRKDVMLAAHLGAVMEDGQPTIGRDPAACLEHFHDFLRRYRTDYADVLFLFNSNTPEDYERLTGPGGLLEIAHAQRKKGAARLIGFGGHNAATARRAVESGLFDVVIFPVNLTCRSVPGNRELHETCRRLNVGLVGMKPYAGGHLLEKAESVSVEDFQMGRTEMSGAPTRFEKRQPITPVQCLSYALSQPGVSTVIPGCKDVDQLADALAWNNATAAERDIARLLPDFDHYPAGQCVYCNHCLPCPAHIDIGKTLSLRDRAQAGLTDELRAAFGSLPVQPSECLECGDCTERCPFGVDVVPRMRQAARLLARGAGD